MLPALINVRFVTFKLALILSLHKKINKCKPPKIHGQEVPLLIKYYCVALDTFYIIKFVRCIFSTAVVVSFGKPL